MKNIDWTRIVSFLLLFGTIYLVIRTIYFMLKAIL